MKIIPYKMESISAKNLANTLGVVRVRHEGKSLNVNTLINWGLSSKPERVINAKKIINDYTRVARGSNKLQCLERLERVGVSIPNFTTSREEAEKWVCGGGVVFARRVLNGNSGAGIVECSLSNGGDRKYCFIERGNVTYEDEMVNAPLYTIYIKKKREFRIHCFINEGVSQFFTQEKLKRRGEENVNSRIRNHANGYIFAHTAITLPDGVLKLAEDAVKALELDFGACDIIYNEHQNKSYVLEVNTAPGIEGATLEFYRNCFNQI